MAQVKPMLPCASENYKKGTWEPIYLAVHREKPVELLNTYGTKPVYELVKWNGKTKVWDVVSTGLDKGAFYYDIQPCLYIRPYTGDIKHYAPLYIDNFSENSVSTSGFTKDSKYSTPMVCPPTTHMVDKPSPSTCTPATQTSIAYCTSSSVAVISCEPDIVKDESSIPIQSTPLDMRKVEYPPIVFNINPEELLPGHEYQVCISTNDGHNIIIQRCAEKEK